LTVALRHLAEAGYEAQPLLVRSDDFWLPQARRRLYIVAYFKESDRFSSTADFDEIMPRVVHDLKNCRVSAPCLREVLLPLDDDRVHQELMRRMETPGSSSSKLGSQAWPRDYRSFLDNKGIRQSTLRASPETRESPWFSTLCPRERQVLAYEQVDAGEEAFLFPYIHRTT
jgi:site-specific DNA-cytosine methylase